MNTMIYHYFQNNNNNNTLKKCFPFLWLAQPFFTIIVYLNNSWAKGMDDVLDLVLNTYF